MGREAKTGGVIPKGDRIQVTFQYQGKQYRPTLNWKPTQTSLRQASKLREKILEQIRQGTFSFTEHFPDYRFISSVGADDPGRTWGAVADDYYASIGGLEYATRESYRKIIAFWKTRNLAETDKMPLGRRTFTHIRYGELARFIGAHRWGSNKTRNNKVSVLRRVFDFGYADIEGKRNPAEKLEMLKVQKPDPDPYALAEALAIIEDSRRHWGESYGNYVEFQFFSGARPSETIALTWPKVDQRDWRVRIDQARVMGKDKQRTKTAVSRDIECCPRLQAMLQRQFTLTGTKGENVFGWKDSSAFHDLQIPWKRWQETHVRLKIRHREPYQARHTSVTWNLLMGKNLLWVARQHGHSAAVMLKTYAKWIDRTTAEDIEALRAAFAMQAPHLKVLAA